MNATQEIQNILNTVNSDNKNKTKNNFLNVIHNEFITFKGKIEIPKISVKELEYDLSVDIVKKLVEYIPEFLYEHSLLEKRKPESEQHSLHFISIIKGKHIYFTHIIKIDLKFSGDTTNVIVKGNSDYYPSYVTDRIYYKSKIIPQYSVLHHKDHVIDFIPIRLKDAHAIESDEYFHTFAIFDDLNTDEISKKLCLEFDQEIFPISLDLYPFIVYDYFTACFNVIYPDSKELSIALDIFEPIFIFLYSKFKDIEKLIKFDTIKEKFDNELDYNNGSLILKKKFISKLKEYFNRFSLHRDDELSLLGWWRFDVTGKRDV